MTTASEARMHLAVFGRVQGVGFRWFTERSATRLGLAGWVRNRADGSVELEAAGNPDAMAALQQALRAGPPGARVDRIEQLAVTDEALPKPFAIRRHVG
jgi:acylphosphatase